MDRDSAEALVGQYVRIKAKDSSQHMGRGPLIAVRSSTAFVKPFGHGGHTEEIPLEKLHTWKSGNLLNRNFGVTVRSLETPNREEENRMSKPLNPRDGEWVIQDLLSGKVFVNTWHNFKPELNRAKGYASQGFANKAIGHLVKRNGSPQLLSEFG